jgi:hypothetical protein
MAGGVPRAVTTRADEGFVLHAEDLEKAIIWLEQLICHQKSNEQNPLQCCTPCRDIREMI